MLHGGARCRNATHRIWCERTFTCYDRWLFAWSVYRLGLRCYKNASDFSAISHACQARGIWRTTRHADKRSSLHRIRPPADQSRNARGKLNGKVARHARHPRSILQDVARVGRVREDATMMLCEETAPVEFRLSPKRADSRRSNYRGATIYR